MQTELLKMVLGRASSLFAGEISRRREQIADAANRSRVLVIGAGGSIGAAFIKALLPFGPTSLHLVDLSENNLVWLVRDLRADGLVMTEDFHTYAIGFESEEFALFLKERGPFDYVLNFAALKHVRSERDPYTLMRLLRVNVMANAALAGLLRVAGVRRVFCVSSDKAVNPASVMGASKAFMERVYLAQSPGLGFTSARFANVAFSAGSLLESFLTRLEKRQPLAAPTDVRRYFISAPEAGELCLLAAFLGHDGEIFTPRLDPRQDLKSFSDIAEAILERRGFRPISCATEAEARERAAHLGPESREWPCIFAPSNTSGEKPCEEFLYPSERVDDQRLENILVVTSPRQTDPRVVQEALNRLRALLASGQWDHADLIRLVQAAVPEFQHMTRQNNLDHKI
jgi:FlaA1/EpsC-like NDP-sugar epimerase